MNFQLVSTQFQLYVVCREKGSNLSTQQVFLLENFLYPDSVSGKLLSYVIDFRIRHYFKVINLKIFPNIHKAPYHE